MSTPFADLASEIEHLRNQRDSLQASNTALLERARAAESLPRVTVAVIVYRVDGTVLVMRRADGSWCHPGGRIEAGETVEECAARKLEEESGIVVPVSAVQRLGFWSHERAPNGKSFLLVWCRVVVGASTVAKIAEPDIFTAYGWCSRGDGWPQPLLMGSATMVARGEIDPWRA